RKQAKIIFIEWPVGQCGFPNDVLAGHKSPFSRIGAIAAIISHDKVLVSPHNTIRKWTKRIKRVILVDIRLVQLDTVNCDLLTNHADSIARNGNDALDIVYLRIEGVFKDDHVSALRGVKEVCCFINKYVFLVMQTRFHTLPIYTIVLHSEPEHQEYQEGQ